MPAKKPAAKTEAPARKPAAARLFLVYGTDDLLAQRKADEIVARLCPPEQQAFGLETITPEPGADSAEAVCAILRNTMEALRTPSFLGGAKTVYLRGASCFNPLTEPGRFADVKAAIEKLVELLRGGLPAEVACVVLADSVNKSTAFYKTFQTAGEVQVFDEPEKDREAEEDFIPRVEQLIAEKGLVLPPAVFRALLGRTGYSLRQVESELEKLALYLGDRKEATLADIQLMVAPVRESKFYEFADTFCSGNLADTLRVLRRLYDQRVFPVPLLVNLQDRLRQLFVLSDCLKRGWARLSGGDKWRKLDWQLPPEGEEVLAALEKDPRKGNPYAVSLMAAQAVRQPPAHWYRWLTAAVDAQAAMTGGEQVDPEVALELFVLRALGELAPAK